MGWQTTVCVLHCDAENTLCNESQSPKVKLYVCGTQQHQMLIKQTSFKKLEFFQAIHKLTGLLGFQCSLFKLSFTNVGLPIALELIPNPYTKTRRKQSS